MSIAPPSADDEPLGVRLAKALQAAGVRQRDGLRQVGDHSLFISGFFADSLNRSLVDVDYYIQLGELRIRFAGAAGRRPRLERSSTSLRGKFTAFVDVLGEVSERTALSSNSDLLAALRKVGADQEPPQRQPSRVPRNRPERFCREPIHPVTPLTQAR